MIDHVTTSGLFTLDGEDFEVENNVWLVGDADEVLVVDAAHDASTDRRRASSGDGRSRSCSRTATTTTSTRLSRSQRR